MKKPTPRQQGIHSAGSILTQSAIGACQGRSNQVPIDLLHAEIGTIVRMVLAGQIEEGNERLDGFCDALGGFIHRCFEDEQPDDGPAA